MVLEKDSLRLLEDALERLEVGFEAMVPFVPVSTPEAWRDVLLSVAERMQDNFPYPHPLYAGQMLKPPHPIARLAYMLALWINPNNHALDGGRASSVMEKEAVAEIANMFGWEDHLGHLTSGGTMANLEALWVAGNLAPGKIVLASSQAHYTHGRISALLQQTFRSVPADPLGRMDIAALEEILQQEDVAVVVATMGTTGVGAVDPLPEILALREKYGFRVHADAAYGGYFALVDSLDAEVRAAYDRLDEVDSIAIDPHKHGLQPYGCGCILFRDPAVGRFYKHDSPYTYFSSDALHLGEISLECSRAGASAVALWATQQLLPLERGGAFAADLGKSHQAAVELHGKITADSRFITPFAPQLDIVIWAPKADNAEALSAASRRFMDEAAQRDLHLAVMSLPTAFFAHIEGVDWNNDTVTCVRSCLMKPEHLDWVDQLWNIIDQTADAV